MKTILKLTVGLLILLSFSFYVLKPDQVLGQDIYSGSEIYFGDIHSHTLVSDGELSMDEALTFARDTAQLDFAAIADHSWNNLWGPSGANEGRGEITPEEWLADVVNKNNQYNSPGSFVTLNAFEWQLNAGDPQGIPSGDGTQENFGHRNVYFLGTGDILPPRKRLGDNGYIDVYLTPELLWQALRDGGHEAFTASHHVSSVPNSWDCTGLSWRPPSEGDFYKDCFAADWNHYDEELELLVEIYSKWGAGECEDCLLNRTSEFQPELASIFGFGLDLIDVPRYAGNTAEYPNGPCKDKAFGTCVFDSRTITLDQSTGHRVESISAYGKAWNYDIDDDHKPLSIGVDLTTIPRYAGNTAEYPNGPCKDKIPGTCVFDSRTITLDQATGHRMESITAYGKAWNYDIDDDHKPITLGYELTQIERYAGNTAEYPNGPCKDKAFGTCVFDTKTITLDQSTGHLVESITAYGKTWNYDIDDDHKPLSIGVDLTTVPRYTDGPCKGKAINECRFDSRTIVTHPITGHRVESITAYGKTWNYDIDEEHKYIPDSGFALDEPCYYRRNNFVQDALARGYKLGFIAGSDSHMSKPGGQNEHEYDPYYARPADTPPSTRRNTVGLSVFSNAGLTGMWLEELSRETVYSAMKNRRVYATTGSRTKLKFSADGHFMGEEYQTAVPPTFNVIVEAFDNNYDPQPSLISSVEIVKGIIGEISPFPVVYTHDACQDQTSCSFSWRDDDFTEDAFYYLRVIQEELPQEILKEDDTAVTIFLPHLAWSSPIWVDQLELNFKDILVNYGLVDSQLDLYPDGLINLMDFIKSFFGN